MSTKFIFLFTFYTSLLLMSFLFQVSDYISADMRIRDEKVEQVIKEKEKMWKAINEDLLKMVELLSKEKAEKEEGHEAERWRR